MRTLRVLKTSTLSVVSAITLSIRSGCLSLTDRAPESSLRLSPWTPVSRWLLSGLHANYCNQTQVFLILHLTHLLTAVSWVFLPLQTSLNHAPLATLCLNSQKIFFPETISSDLWTISFLFTSDWNFLLIWANCKYFGTCVQTVSILVCSVHNN